MPWLGLNAYPSNNHNHGRNVPLERSSGTVAGTGYKGNSSGELTRGAYSFCCPYGSDGSQYDGDGVTPIDSALAMKLYMTQCDTLVLDNVGHFCWSDVFGGSFVAPELTKYHLEGRPWYGDDAIVDK